MKLLEKIGTLGIFGGGHGTESPETIDTRRYQHI